MLVIATSLHRWIQAEKGCSCTPRRSKPHRPYRRARISAFTLLLLFSTSFAGDYEFEAAYTGDVLRNVSGGIEAGTRYLDKLDLNFKIDVAEAWGTGAGTLFMHGLYNNGSTLSDELVGDLQVTSNIDTTEAWRIFELWYELGGDTWSVRTGLYDLNSEFDVNETGSLFLNSSHGIGAELSQTGENGPSIFPVSSLALRTAVQIDSVTVRFALIDAAPGMPDDWASIEPDLNSGDGYLTVAELDAPIAESARLWAGYWHYSAELERPFGMGSGSGNNGWYVGGEQKFQIGFRSAAWFVRFGQADERLNKLKYYVGFGVVTDGLFAARPDDQFGIAVASAHAGEPYRNYLDQVGVGAARRETAWEITYRAQLTEHLVLQPNFQYVRNPSVPIELDDALVIGFRFEIVY